MTTTDPAERLRAMIGSGSAQELMRAYLDRAIDLAYQRGRDEAVARMVVEGTVRMTEEHDARVREDERERIRARALEYFGDGITPREVDAILDAQADHDCLMPSACGPGRWCPNAQYAQADRPNPLEDQLRAEVSDLWPDAGADR